RCPAIESVFALKAEHAGIKRNCLVNVFDRQYRTYIFQLHVGSTRAAGLIVQIEVNQIPVIREPYKTDAGNQQQEVPHFGPEPGMAVSPAAQTSQKYQDCP